MLRTFVKRDHKENEKISYKLGGDIYKTYNQKKDSWLKIQRILTFLKRISKKKTNVKMGKGHEQSFDRRNTNGQWTYEKMLNFISVQGNAN